LKQCAVYQGPRAVAPAVEGRKPAELPAVAAVDDRRGPNRSGM